MFKFERMPIEAESPEEKYGYDKITNNLAESSMPDRVFGDLGIKLDHLVLQYTDHRGALPLRKAIASEAGLPADSVLIAPGAVCSLFLIHSAILGPGDHLLVMQPNYATNVVTPLAMADAGVKTTLWQLHADDFALDVPAFVAAMTPATKLVSVTSPHNPSGRILSDDDLRAILEGMSARAHPDCKLLVDETYREMAVNAADVADGDSASTCSDGGASARAAAAAGAAALAARPWAASLDRRVISVSSMSKTYGLPGIRIGWSITADPALQERLLAAKEQVAISGSVIDEEIAAQILSRKATMLPDILAEVSLRKRIVVDWLAANADIVACTPPQGGVVCFPRIRPAIDYSAFGDALFADSGTIVGLGHWFSESDAHFRLGFGWSTVPQLRKGLDGIAATIRRMAAAAGAAGAAAVVSP